MAEFRYARAADVEKQTCVFCVATAACYTHTHTHTYTRAHWVRGKRRKKGERKEKNVDVYTSHGQEVEGAVSHTPCDVSAGIAIRDARDPVASSAVDCSRGKVN